MSEFVRETAVKGVSGAFTELIDVHEQHLAPIAIVCRWNLVCRCEVASIITSRGVHADIVHQQRDAVVSVKPRAEFSAHPLADFRIDARVKFRRNGYRFRIREQVPH